MILILTSFVKSKTSNLLRKIFFFKFAAFVLGNRQKKTKEFLILVVLKTRWRRVQIYGQNMI